jgi:uncharacterized coiled-coil DUF342 family protein
MSEAETLRMVAEVQDRYSGPLRALRAQLQSIRPTREMQAVKKDFQDLGSVVQGVSTGMRTGLAPVMSSLGVGSIGVAGAVAALVGGLRNLTRENIAMQRVGRETGFATENLREFQAVARKFDIAPDEVQGDVKNFAKNMFELRHNTGEFMLFLRRTPAGQEWADKLRKAKNDTDAFRIAIEMLAAQKDPIKRGMLAGAAGLPSFTGVDDLKKAREALSEARSEHGQPNVKLDQAAREANNAWMEFDKAIKQLTVDTLPFATSAIRAFSSTLKQMSQDGDTLISSLVSGLKSLQTIDPVKDGAQHRQNELARMKAERDRADREIDRLQNAGAPKERVAPLIEKRDMMDDQIRQFEEKIKEGARDGVKEGLEAVKRMSLNGSAGFEGMVQRASYGPSGAGRRSTATGEGATPSSGASGGADEAIPKRDPVGQTGRERIQSWHKFLTERMGMTHESAKGVIANFQGESGRNLNPNLVGDGGTSYGVAQWHASRWTDLKQFAAKNGLDWKTTEAQQEFFRHEMTRKFSGLTQFLQNNRSSEAATRRMVYEFERPARPAADTAKRQGNIRPLGALLDQENQRERSATKVEGSANLRIDLNGFPKGTKLDMSTGGGLFEQVQVNRAPAMATASEAE